MITPENIIIHELVGLYTTVIQSNDLGIVGISGKVVDETKHMFVLDTENGIKKIAKENSLWKFSLANADALVSGDLLAKKPWERIGVRA